MRELARDGTRITKTIIGMGGYQSVSGNYIRIDSSGDSEGNFTAYALKKHNFTQISKFTGKTFTSTKEYFKNFLQTKVRLKIAEETTDQG